TSYATQGEIMVPFYIFYSMFGFQRTGDQFWAAGDQLTRGFIVGATAGRTTLTGEGLQHADGHSPLIAGTNTAVVQYDPAYGYEIRHIVRDGIERMFGDGTDGRDQNVMYDLTAYNEPMVQPAEPEDVDVEGILKGIHRISVGEGDGPRAQLLASGVGVPWALEAQQLLKEDWGVTADVWSVTSWNELRRDALAADQAAFLDPASEPRVPFVTARLSGAEGPFVATSDYDHLVPDQIRKWVPGDYEVLGADGFGFSDTRAAARRHFKLDGRSPPRGGVRPSSYGLGRADDARRVASPERASGAGAVLLGLRDGALQVRAQGRDALRVAVLDERREVVARLERAVGLDRSEDELTADLGVVVPRAPVPDAEAQRLGRQAGRAQDLHRLRERAPGRVALRGGREPAQRGLLVVVEREPPELDERVPALGVPGELLGERPDREVGRALLLRLVDGRGERVVGGGALRGAPADQLRERAERPLVVR